MLRLDSVRSSAVSALFFPHPVAVFVSFNTLLERGSSGTTVVDPSQNLCPLMDVAFGAVVLRPFQKKVLTKTERQRLEKQTEAGFVTGIDMTSEEAQRKREARAQKYGTEVFDYGKARADVAGLSTTDLAGISAAR